MEETLIPAPWDVMPTTTLLELSPVVFYWYLNMFKECMGVESFMSSLEPSIFGILGYLNTHLGYDTIGSLVKLILCRLDLFQGISYTLRSYYLDDYET